MKEEIFNNDAKQLVDLIFETRLFKDDVKRDDMNEMEKYIGFCLQSRFESYQRATKLLERIKSTHAG